MALLKIDKKGNIIKTYASDAFRFLQYLNSGYFIGESKPGVNQYVKLYHINNGSVSTIRTLSALGAIPARTSYGGISWNKKNYYQTRTRGGMSIPPSYVHRVYCYSKDWKLIKMYEVENTSTTSYYNKGLAHDGKYLWIIKSGTKTLEQIETGTFKKVNSFYLSGFIGTERDVCYDGKFFWVTFSELGAVAIGSYDKKGNVAKRLLLSGTTNEAIMTDGKYLYVS